MDFNGEKFSQIVELRGHIIDSMILPRVLDTIIGRGAEFTIIRLDVGRHKAEPSYALVDILAGSMADLEELLTAVQQLGAIPVRQEDVELAQAPADGVFPEGFYSTTNMPMEARLGGHWIAVAHPEMDCAIVVEGEGAQCIPMNDVRAGQLIVVGHKGVKINPVERSRNSSPVFHFMGSAVSSEKPKRQMIREIAGRVLAVKRLGGKVLVVAGPAVIHVGARDDMRQLVESHTVDFLFAGNGFATHDIEGALYGTSLGISLDGGVPSETGHQHHLRAINRIRAAGGIRRAIDEGILRQGVMYSCVRNGVEFVLAGSIRDDGPLPDVITDVMSAQAAMRRCIHDGVEVCLMLSSMLHSIAVGNLLPANVYTVCVDINPGTLTKLVDRGSLQTVGLVMDVGSFLHDLVEELATADESQ
jgi:lysine-ketoglutarate reductase/saccharopine dehydrogenase-like protein (TIGR00300 family)